MKKITAIVRQEKLEVLKDALFAADVRGMTINQVQGCGAQHGWKEYVRGNELLVNTIPKVQFTLICLMSTLTELSTSSAMPPAPVPSATARFGSSRSKKSSAFAPANTARPRCRIDRLPSATLKCCNEAQDLRCGWADYGSQ